MILPVTLTAAAAAAVTNIWLSMRIGGLRRAHSISVGDGGNEPLSRRMRAQLNFAENVPVVLILIAGIELAGKGGAWLLPVSGVFLFGRIAHAIGMDGGAGEAGRMIGTIVTLLTQIGLAVVAMLVVAGVL